MDQTQIKKIIKDVVSEYIKKEKELVKIALDKQKLIEIEKQKKKEEKLKQEQEKKEQMHRDKYKRTLTFETFLREFDLSEELQDWGDGLFKECFPDKYEILNKKYEIFINELRDLLRK